MSKLLGELTIELDGKKVKLKPTFEAILMMEDESGRTTSELVKILMNSSAGLKDVVAVIYSGMFGANDNKKPSLSMSDVGNKVLKQGFVNFYGDCCIFVASVYTGKSIDEATQLREDKKNNVRSEKKTKNVAQA